MTHGERGERKRERESEKARELFSHMHAPPQILPPIYCWLAYVNDIGRWTSCSGSSRFSGGDAN